MGRRRREWDTMSNGGDMAAGEQQVMAARGGQSDLRMREDDTPPSPQRPAAPAEEASTGSLQLAAIDHRLKSAFMVIAGWARTLDTDWERLTPEQRQRGIAAIRSRAEAMVVQTELLLAQLRPGALLPTAEESTDLARLCRQAVDAYDASTTHRVVYRGPDELTVAASVDSVDQIIEQLLENAIKFSPPCSLVEASVHDTQDGGVLVVRDQGPGIPEGIDIFEAFARGHAEVPGSGIGLSVVASLVEAAGGTVRARRLPGSGSQFAVVIPKAPAA